MTIKMKNLVVFMFTLPMCNSLTNSSSFMNEQCYENTTNKPLTYKIFNLLIWGVWGVCFCYYAMKGSLTESKIIHTPQPIDFQEIVYTEQSCTDCSICLELFQIDKVIKKLKCGHIFHPKCIDGWFDVGVRCPICRRDSRKDTIELQGRPAILFEATLHPDIRFGAAIVTTDYGLCVTYVEPNGAGYQQGVEVGDYLLRQDGDIIPHIDDVVFVQYVSALARPVKLGFARQIERSNM